MYKKPWQQSYVTMVTKIINYTVQYAVYMYVVKVSQCILT